MQSTFVQLYKYWCGRTTTPARFDEWGAISLVAAAAEERVYCEHETANPIYPNLYTLFLAPSGVGKGAAIKRVESLVRSHPSWSSQALYVGKMTGQALVDWMSGRTQSSVRRVNGFQLPTSQAYGPKHPAAYVLNEELALDIGRKAMADDFVKYMTGLYDGPRVWFDGTRTNGIVELSDVRINWLAASTRAWLHGSLTADAISGGFFGRTYVIDEAACDERQRFAPYKPSDHEEVFQILTRLVAILRDVKGEIVVDRAVRQALQMYLDERTTPESEDPIAPWWRRELVHLYKLIMVAALSEWCCEMALWEDDGGVAQPPPLVAQMRHLQVAHRALRDVNKVIPNLLAESVETREMRMARQAAILIRRNKRLAHSDLLKAVWRQGNAAVVNAAVALLEQQGLVETTFEGGDSHGAHRYLEYHWIGGTRVRLANLLNRKMDESS
jgi:hypothetical protein